MKIKQIIIKSNDIDIFWGIERGMVDPHTEAVQKLIINDTGGIHFMAYKIDNSICRDISVDIGAEAAGKIIELIDLYFKGERMAVGMDDVGIWQMKVVYANGDSDKCEGALIGGVVVSDTDMTKFIRKEIPIENMYVFDSRL